MIKRYIKFWTMILFISLLSFGCSSSFSTVKLHTKSKASKRVRLLFQPGTSPTMINTIKIKTAKTLPTDFELVNHNEDITLYFSQSEFNANYTISYFVVPILLSYLGSPIGTLSKQVSLRVVDKRKNRVISIWQGKIRKTLFLYYLEKAAKRDINKIFINLFIRKIRKVLQID